MTRPEFQMPHDTPTLGGTSALGDHQVHRIGFGAMRLLFLPEGARSDAVALLHRVVELGVDHIDTAAYYGDGFINELLREVVTHHRDVVIVTKIGAAPAAPGAAVPFVPAQRPAELREGVEANLRTLGVDRLDVVNLRRHDNATGDQRVDLDDQLAELVNLRDEGLIGGIGLSAIDMATLERALPVGIACVQNEYSLLNRADESLLQLCSMNNVGWVPYFPLGGGGFAASGNVVEHPTVVQAADTLGVSPSQLGLAWLLHHDPSILLIPGTTSIDHLEANAAAGDIALPADIATQLDELVPPA